ncbi:uncharacterized protein BP5553_05833 [Venustampulla echinocandica]|uniref:beta-glucosidase n=1 Tax=Venustampulla echinocandica TaxID=2656787 RepID=A0A370TLS6_9HELO|nr:uncharacterized protein BP5553_05833 [Venustampulla echinocandica]RDL36481.1 hypothetical protein BP5553_05833 [Venustampulla echinocandica]
MVSIRCFALALLAPVYLFDGATSQAIGNDSYFYGDSPPVYPSPQGTGLGYWNASYTKAKALVAQLTRDKKNNLTYGADKVYNGCAGRVPALQSAKFPGLCLQDAGNGVRGTDFVNAYPSGLYVGASWNKHLTKRLANAMAGEFRTKGINVALGPVVGPMGRIAKGGRNWEGIAADP